jgi:hypothetical protein
MFTHITISYWGRRDFSNKAPNQLTLGEVVIVGEADLIVWLLKLVRNLIWKIFLLTLKSKQLCCEQPMMIRTVVSSCKAVPCHQLPSKWGFQSHGNKELNFANTMRELGSRSFPDWSSRLCCSWPLTSAFGSLNWEPSPVFWTPTQWNLWDNKSVLSF